MIVLLFVLPVNLFFFCDRFIVFISYYIVGANIHCKEGWTIENHREHWKNIHYFNLEKNSFKQWLAAIAKYKAIDYQRRQIIIQHQQFSVSEIDESMLKAIQPSEISCVDELLEQLSASERKIFEKYYLEGTPSSEIAKEFNAKESWVYNKLSRGRKKLRNFLIKNNEV